MATKYIACELWQRFYFATLDLAINTLKIIHNKHACQNNLIGRFFLSKSRREILIHCFQVNAQWQAHIFYLVLMKIYDKQHYILKYIYRLCSV